MQRRQLSPSKLKQAYVFNMCAVLGLGSLAYLTSDKPETERKSTERIISAVRSDLDRSMQKLAVVGASLHAFSLVAKKRSLTEGECAFVLTDERKGQELFKWAIVDLQQFQNIGASGYHAVHLARLNETYRRNVADYQGTSRQCYRPLQYADPLPPVTLSR